MPDNVLEQFVLDHGLDLAFQREYATLDIHQLSWILMDLPTGQIVASSSKFNDFVTDVAVSVMTCFSDKPHPPSVHPQSWQIWIESGTWLRPPVFLDSALEGRPGLHLVEGHERVGTLKGLLETPLTTQNTHPCWVGRRSSASQSFDYGAAFQDHPVAFRSWLYDGVNIEHESLRRHVALRLSRAEVFSHYTTFEALVELTRAGKTLGVNEADLCELVEQWRSELSVIAGRALTLSP
jgi:hypothetical protein